VTGDGAVSGFFLESVEMEIYRDIIRDVSMCPDPDYGMDDSLIINA
jgi:hypothetical protein